MTINKQHGGTMTYAEKLAKKIISSIKLTRDANPNYPMDYLIACESLIQKRINQAMQAQREATLQRLNQYALDTAGEVMPPEMQFIVLHTPVDAEVKV